MSGDCEWCGEVDLFEILRATNERIQEIESKLPRYLDTGEAFVPGRDEAWCVQQDAVAPAHLSPIGTRWMVLNGTGPYSTREAAERAMKGAGDGDLQG